MRGLLNRLIRETSGQDLVEVALLLVFLSLAAIVSIQELACNVNCVFEDAGNFVEQAVGKIPPGQQKKCSKKC